MLFSEGPELSVELYSTSTPIFFYLDTSVSHRSQKPFTLQPDVRPSPLEEMDEGLTVAGRIEGVIRCARNQGQTAHDHHQKNPHFRNCGLTNPEETDGDAIGFIPSRCFRSHYYRIGLTAQHCKTIQKTALQSSHTERKNIKKILATA